MKSFLCQKSYKIIPALFGLIILILLNVVIAQAQFNRSIGIQPNFVSPFKQKISYSKAQVVRPDSIDDFSISKQNNDIRIKFSKQSKIKATDFFETHRKEMGITDKEKFELKKQEQDDIGMTHYRYQQTYEGVEVKGGTFLIHEKNGRLVRANGRFYDNLNINTKPTISEHTAIENAMKNVGAEKWMWNNPEAEKFLKETIHDPNATYLPKPVLIISPIGGIYDKENFRLCYRINIAAEYPSSHYDVYVDAHTGEVINKISQIFDANTIGIAETLYSGTKNITTDSYDGKFRLREYLNGRNIETYDLEGTINNPFDFKDKENNWTQEQFITSVTLNSMNDNWFDYDNPYLGGKPEIFIIIKDDIGFEIYRSKIKNSLSPIDLKWNMNIMLNHPPYTMEIWDEDLTKNDLISSFTISNIEGENFFSSGDGTEGKYKITSKKNPALDVHWGMERTYDFYKNVLNRNGYNNTNGLIKSYININNSAGNGFPNGASFQQNTNTFIFGLGDGVNFNPLVSLDIIGHEYTHAVIRYNGNGGLDYQNESGALNESFADIFATRIEFYNDPVNANWNIGELVYNPSPGYLRSMGNPKIGPFNQPDTYKLGPWKPLTNFPNDKNDYGGVHYNSGIQNFWFYLLSHGGSENSPNDKGDYYNVTAIGIDHASKIAYYNLTNNLFPEATYNDAVNGSIDAAIDLYGSGSQEEISVKNAWYAVGLYNNPESYCSGTVVYEASSGSFDDGSGKMFYQNNSDCKWLIKPQGADNITLTFTAFNTENINDKIIVYDGPTTESPILMECSGSTLPTVITSTSGAMLVRFKTNESIGGSGWQANYKSGTTTSYCTGFKILNSSSGTFSDGSGSNNYGNNAQCSWLISPPGATSISLSFTSFNTELNTDGVIVYDGSSTNDPILGKFTGTDIPSNISSTGAEMLVVFISNNSGNASGWSASYTSIGSAYCSGITTLNNFFGSFTDGSGVNNYHNNSDCSWLIKPLGATSITLSFSEFALELPSSDGKSIFDYLEVYDGDDETAPLIGTFTGTTIPETLVSKGGSLFVHFHSDNATTATGWAAEYTSSSESYCSGTSIINNSSGSFNDGSGTGDYGNNSDCKWLIQPANATSIVLTFTSFNTEQGYDGILVYDGDNIYSPLIGIYTGTTLPPQINSTGGSLLVRFISDGRTTDQGWSVNYEANISTGGNGSLITYEYWFDDDYSSKISNSIIPVNSYYLNRNFKTESLETGLHSFHIRIKDKNGTWSSVVSEFFHKLPVTADGNRKIVACEYWFDEGYDSKVLNSVTDGQVVSINNELDVAKLSTGLHSYHIRYKDDAGQWSSVVSEFFHKLPVIANGIRTVTGCEYWFDEAYDSKVLTAVTDGQVVSINSGFDVAKLSTGLHSYHVRYKDNAGLWSSVVSEFFQKLPIAADGTRKITACEYWFDDAYTNKVTTPITEGQIVSVNGQLEVGNLSNGLHRYHVRYKDDAGQWSSVASEFFHKLPATTSAGNLITTYRYWFDTNSQAMNTVTLPDPVNPYQLIRNINTCNITDGNHTLHFQFRDSNKQWSSVASTTVAKSAIVVPTITANGATTICRDSSITLTSSEAENYLWSNGATTQSIIVTEGGNYSVTVNQGTACALTSDVTIITVNSLPLSAGAISGNNVVAKGQTITYTVSPISNASSYTWTLPEGATGVSTSNSITVSFGESAVSGLIKVKGHNDCGDGPESSLTITLSDVLTQALSLNAGWNIISSYVSPTVTELKTIFQPLIDSGKLKKVMDESGKSLENFGAFGGWKNNIGNWQISEGYKVNVTQSCSLLMEGSPVPLPMDINLNAGWNIISYPSASMQDPMTMLQPLITAGKLKKVMDESGRSLENFGAFGGWKNNIGNILPGKGYKVNMTTASVLTMPSDGVKSAGVIPQVLASTHFKPVYQGNGTDHMNIHLVDLTKSAIRQGDEIGIFDGKLCVGSATVGVEQMISDQVSLVASANDELQQKVNGFTKGHRVGIKLYRDLIVYDLPVELLNNSAGTFISGESMFARARVDQSITGLEDSQFQVKCYPNPFSKEVSIEVNPGKAQKMEVSVFDVNGKLMRKLYKGEIKEKKVVVWDGKNERGVRMVAGMYFIHVNEVVTKIIYGL